MFRHLASFPSGKSAQNSPPPPVLRRVFHIFAGSLIPLGGLTLPHTYFMPLLVGLVVIGVVLELVRARCGRLNRRLLSMFSPLMKTEEDSRVTGATFMLIAGLIAFLVFDKHVAAAAMLFLSLGDPAAALVGTRLPGPRFFGKSPGGTLAFVVVALAVCAGLVWTGVSPFSWELVAGAVVAAFVELLPAPLDDNLTVPLVSGGAMHLLGA